MKRMVVEIQERQKVVAGHQEAAAVEQISVAATQRDALARKQTEVEKLQAEIEVCLAAQKVNPLQLTAATMDPQSQVKQSGKGPRKVEDVRDIEH